MQERVSEIIEVIIEELSQHTDPFGKNLDKISEKLLAEGYTEGEIHKAVEWIILNINKEQQSLSSTPPLRTPPALRTLTTDELNFFTPEAYGYLIQIQLLGIVTPLQIEQIIDRCFFMGITRIDVKDVKVVVTQILLGKRVGTFDTNAVYYPGNDKIN